MPSERVPIGFVGLGRLGVPVARRLLDRRYPVACCARGRSAELVARGAVVPGDGSPRAVAESAPVVLTCLPGHALTTAFTGDDGILAAQTPSIVLELSTAPAAEKQALRDRLAERGGDLLDCPVSGNPEMVAAGRAVVYASGARAVFERVGELLAAVSPQVEYVGGLGQGLRMKYVANLLAVVHVAVTAEAMALAAKLGLDLAQVAELVARSPAATSGQFATRAPLIVDRRFEGRLVTVGDARENLAQITAVADAAGANIPLTKLTRRAYDALGEAGADHSDPARLFLALLDQI